MLATVLIILILVGYIALNLILFNNREKIIIGASLLLYIIVHILYEVIVW